MSSTLAQLETSSARNGEWNGLLHVPSSAHTLPGFREWVLSDEFPEKLPATYVQGEVYLDMSKENIQSHAAVKTAVCVPLALLTDEGDLGNFYINGVLVTNEPADLSTNPDGVLVSWDSLKRKKVRYVANQKGQELEIAGSPDWLLEIVSDSSEEKDTKLLREAYHQARVGEYWLIDARLDLVFTILHWKKPGYVPAPVEDGWQHSRVFQRMFRLTRRKDRRGAWKYALQVRA